MIFPSHRGCGKTKQVNKKIIHAGIVLLLLNGFVFGQEPVDSAISVRLSAGTYKLKKKVHLYLFNNSNDTIRFYPELGYLSINIEKEDSGGWRSLDVIQLIEHTPCVVAFAPGKNTSYDWDQTVNDRTNWPRRIRISAGKYRVKFIYWKSCGNSVPKLKGEDYCPYDVTYSNEFEIY